MKKIFLLIIALVAIALVVVSCTNEEQSSSVGENNSVVESGFHQQESDNNQTSTKENDQTNQTVESTDAQPATDDQATEEAQTQAIIETNSIDTGTEQTQSEEPILTYSTKNDVQKKWSGKTLNVLTQRNVTSNNTSSGPAEQMELYTDYWGSTMVSAQENRTAKIQELYGVTINWLQPTQKNRLTHDIEIARNVDGLYYEIAYPRGYDLFALIGLVYDLNNREYIDFNNSYFSQDANKAFTVSGHTFFADGDFNFVNEEISFNILYNKTLLNEKYGIESLYNEVKNGTWTYDKFVSLIRSMYKDNGNGEVDDLDTYGFGTRDLYKFYRSFGIYGLSAKEKGYEITEKSDITKLNNVIRAILDLRTNSQWAREFSSIDAIDSAFENGRLLFYSDFCQRTVTFTSESFSMGILPYPKLDQEQDRYYTPIQNAYLPIFMCIPKTTSDREMSDYFFDVLSWTGKEYVTAAYYDIKMSQFNESDRSENMDVLKNYVWNNIMYDPAELLFMQTSMFGGIEKKAVEKGYNDFENVYSTYEEGINVNLHSLNSNIDNED